MRRVAEFTRRDRSEITLFLLREGRGSLPALAQVRSRLLRKGPRRAWRARWHVCCFALRAVDVV